MVARWGGSRRAFFGENCDHLKRFIIMSKRLKYIPNTCPHYDEIELAIDKIEEILGEEVFKLIEKHTNFICVQANTIRNTAADLRETAADIAADKNDDIKNLEEQVKNLEEQVKYLEYTLGEKETAIEELQHEVQSVSALI